MARTFLGRMGGSNYYLSGGNMGSSGESSKHANHKFEIVELRGGHESGLMSVSYFLSDEVSYIPIKFKSKCKDILSNLGYDPDTLIK